MFKYLITLATLRYAAMPATAGIEHAPQPDPKGAPNLQEVPKGETTEPGHVKVAKEIATIFQTDDLALVAQQTRLQRFMAFTKTVDSKTLDAALKAPTPKEKGAGKRATFVETLIGFGMNAKSASNRLTDCRNLFVAWRDCKWTPPEGYGWERAVASAADAITASKATKLETRTTDAIALIKGRLLNEPDYAGSTVAQINAAAQKMWQDLQTGDTALRNKANATAARLIKSDDGPRYAYYLGLELAVMFSFPGFSRNPQQPSEILHTDHDGNVTNLTHGVAAGIEKTVQSDPPIPEVK